MDRKILRLDDLNVLFQLDNIVSWEPLIQIAYGYDLEQEIPVPEVNPKTNGYTGYVVGEGHTRIMGQLMLYKEAIAELKRPSIPKEGAPFTDLKIKKIGSPMLRRPYIPWSEIPSQFISEMERKIESWNNGNYDMFR